MPHLLNTRKADEVKFKIMFILPQKLVQPATALAHCPTPLATAQTEGSVVSTIVMYYARVSQSSKRKSPAWMRGFYSNQWIIKRV